MAEVVGETIAKDEKVSIPGFLTFERAFRAERTARNPQTGQIQKGQLDVPSKDDVTSYLRKNRMMLVSLREAPKPIKVAPIRQGPMVSRSTSTASGTIQSVRVKESAFASASGSSW